MWMLLIEYLHGVSIRDGVAYIGDHRVGVVSKMDPRYIEVLNKPNIIGRTIYCGGDSDGTEG